ncbi:MAG: hypothetical protein KDK71_05080 [Chlamydiia bacterium]|nr:hypothetical protein [Chlamydiia bacterium]
MKTYVSLLILLGLFCAGCSASQYHAKDYQGNGYSECRMSLDRFAVTYQGDRKASPEEVRKFALQRAAEVTTNYGYRYFVVESENDHAKTIELSIRCFNKAPEKSGKVDAYQMMAMNGASSKS